MSKVIEGRSRGTSVDGQVLLVVSAHQDEVFRNIRWHRIGDHDVVCNILSRLPVEITSNGPFAIHKASSSCYNVPLHDNIHSVVAIRPPLHLIRNHTGVSIVGTFNDIDVNKYDVFDLKTSSLDFFFSADKVGRFVNGVLYCTISGFRILALNVKEMVFSKTKLPYELKEAWSLILGSIDGCLCIINKMDATRFDLWVNKDQGGIEISWSKACSFTIRLEAHPINPLYIMGNGKVLIIDVSNQLVIYDLYKDSYKRLVGLKSSLYETYVYNDIRPMEYDMC
ncbi:hypothetical protein QVD17_36185 [Tagetes erecta]|uniref:F-box protein n=1 Tax=Tagetes erecta TaxID=13708 RepID=A0AAD8JU39_TARER|nr:hypothetical protein QVD17_36185 [Tagetes erecta]